MEKQKILILATAVAVLTALAVAGAVYAQTNLTPTSTPITGVTGQTSQWGNSATGFCGFRCPWLNGNVGGANTQSGCGTPSRLGTGYGMMGR